MHARPSLRVAVTLQRERDPNPWEAWRHRVIDVALDEGQFGHEARVLRDDGHITTTLHPGLAVTLFTDEGEGYHLNLTSGTPVWFVMWRKDDEDPSRAWPEIVTLSYNEAGRMLDAQEQVENLPLPPAVVAWLSDYTAEHYRPEPKQRRRPASFVPPDKR